MQDAKRRGKPATLWAFLRLSGPGWLQSALTLGGGSLSGSLYLGVLAGFSLLWLQPVAMVMGVIMLSAIGYVTLSTGKRPFHAINEHVNPVLGWSWAIASLMANVVWSMPQFGLGTAAVRQNLLPGVFGEGGMSDNMDMAIIAGSILVVCVIVVWFYDAGSWGVKLFESLLKIVVGVIVLSFIGVVVKMSLAGDLNWSAIFAGFVPDLSLLYSPSASLQPFIDRAPEAYRDFWSNIVVADQRDVMVTAAATAVGINMTFLLPYSMLRRGWDKHFRGLAIFDLSTGLFIPFLLATSCVVIASATQFHREVPADVPAIGAAPAGEEAAFEGLLQRRVLAEHGDGVTDSEMKMRAEMLSNDEKRLAAMLVRRDANGLAQSLEPLTGKTFAHVIFGIGVLAMATSSIILMMLISGFIVCEIGGFKQGGWPHRLGTLIPVVSVCGPFIWKGEAKFWLAVPASIFGMVLIPIAYATFFLMMNNRAIMGNTMPSGGRRVAWNTLMGVAVSLAAFGSVWSIWNKAQWIGIAALAIFLLLVFVVHFAFPRKAVSHVGTDDNTEHAQ